MDFYMDFLRTIRKAVKNQWQLDATASAIAPLFVSEIPLTQS